MSDSQSRYSIVANLTRQKLEFMDEKNNLAKKIEEHMQTIREKKDELASYKHDVEADIARRIREAEKGITILTERLDYESKRQKDMEKHIDSKIEEIDKALKSIEDISKTAPTPQEQVQK